MSFEEDGMYIEPHTDLERIARTVTNLKMQVIAGGAGHLAGVAHIADHFTP